MRENWDFYLLLLAVIAWAVFKARGVWRKEQERRAMLREDLEAFEAQEAAQRANGTTESRPQQDPPASRDAGASS